MNDQTKQIALVAIAQVRAAFMEGRSSRDRTADDLHAWQGSVAQATVGVLARRAIELLATDHQEDV